MRHSVSHVISELTNFRSGNKLPTTGLLIYLALVQTPMHILLLKMQKFLKISTIGVCLAGNSVYRLGRRAIFHGWRGADCSAGLGDFGRCWHQCQPRFV